MTKRDGGRAGGAFRWGPGGRSPRPGRHNETSQGILNPPSTREANKHGRARGQTIENVELLEAFEA
eukprot:10752061-Alexandrium_andersonii.AAC.1